MIALKPAVGCASGSAVRLSSVTPSASNARRKKVFSSPDTMPMKRPNRTLASNVSALASVAPSSVKKLSRKRWSWMKIARHHRIGHGSGEQLVDEAMPHGIRPGRLARSAQYLGEAFRHFGPHLFGPLRVATRRASPLVTHRNGQRRLTVRNG